MDYAVILEKGKSNWSAYVPDLPGCVAAGDNQEETLSLIKEALAFHIEGLKDSGEPIPQPTCNAVTVTI